MSGNSHGSPAPPDLYFLSSSFEITFPGSSNGASAGCGYGRLHRERNLRQTRLGLVGSLCRFRQRDLWRNRASVCCPELVSLSRGGQAVVVPEALTGAVATPADDAGTWAALHDQLTGRFVAALPQPAPSVAAAVLPASHRLAMTRQPEIPLVSSDTIQSSGGTTITGSSSAALASDGKTSGSIPVRVAPPGSRALTVTPVPRRSSAQMMVSDSRAAFDGP